MSTLASPSVQEQQFLEAFQQAIDTQKLDRVVLSQYKGELEQLEKITLRVIQLNQDTVLTCIAIKRRISPKTILWQKHRYN